MALETIQMSITMGLAGQVSPYSGTYVVYIIYRLTAVIVNEEFHYPNTEES